MSSSSPSRRSSGPVIRSLSPSGRFHSPSSPYRSISPTRVNIYTARHSIKSSPSVRFSLDRPISPSRSISSVHPHTQPTNTVKRSCMCSPTTHPGSFRCSLHKKQQNQTQTSSYPSNRLNARRSAMTNSLVRIGTVEGDLLKRALTALIRPSSHHQRRRGVFQTRPSRLSVMSKTED